MTLLSIQALEKRYPGFHLGPLTLELAPGYVYAIMGPNSSGKSTLFRTLIGTVQPTAGRITWLDGRHAPQDPELKRCLAYVPEEIDVPDAGWSIRDWQTFISAWYPERWNQTLYRRLVERYGIDESQELRTASKGMKRKAALAIALAQEPEVLLLDEPSSGLDPFAWRMLLEDLAAFMESGERTILMASHILEEIRRLADYVLFWERGRLLGQYEKDELLSSWRMLWVDSLPAGLADPEDQLPGVVALERELPLRLISNRPQETEQALRAAGIPIRQTKSLELDEIFFQLARMR